MNYQLMDDGAVHIRFEADEKQAVIAYFRFIRGKPEYDTTAIDELLAILEGELFFTSKTRH